MIALFCQQILREMRGHLRELKLCINSCLFFLLIVVFFPLTMPEDPTLLRTIAPGIVWIAMLLALFLSSERLFQQDYADGVIEQWLVSGYPVSVLVLAKMLVHWALNMLPMLLCAPILAILFRLSAYETYVLVLSFICGTPAILALCTLAAAFSTNLKQKGVIMALVLLPFTVPLMILGSGVVTMSMHGLPILGIIALLVAISMAAMTFLPFAIAGVIRVSFVD